MFPKNLLKSFVNYFLNQPDFAANILSLLVMLVFIIKYILMKSLIAEKYLIYEISTTY